MQKYIDVLTFKFRYFSFLLFIVLFFLEGNLFAKEECKLLKREKIDLILDSKPICSKLIKLNNKSNYLVSKMVGEEFLNANLYLEMKSSKGFIQISKSETDSTSTETIDLNGLDIGKYRVCARRGIQSGKGLIHITFDMVSEKCGKGRDTCFGAIGKNCDGGIGGTCNETTKDGLKICQVAIGSQMHDSCCSSNPNGIHCGGNDTLSACGKEWDHAVNDTAATGRNWPIQFDPTIVTYRGSRESKIAKSIQIGKDFTAKPMKGSYKTPVGIDIWDVDAKEGWCINPKRYTKSCTPLTSNCWARCN